MEGTDEVLRKSQRTGLNPKRQVFTIFGVLESWLIKVKASRVMVLYMNMVSHVTTSMILTSFNGNASVKG